jgi:hypothetical protein
VTPLSEAIVAQIKVLMGSNIAHGESIHQKSEDRLLLHAPHPEGNMLHLSLTELHSEIYRVR